MAEPGRPDCRDAADGFACVCLALYGQPRRFQDDDRLYQRRIVGHCADRVVLYRGIFMPAKTSFDVDCALHEFCDLVYHSHCPSMAVEVIDY